MTDKFTGGGGGEGLCIQLERYQEIFCQCSVFKFHTNLILDHISLSV